MASASRSTITDENIMQVLRQTEWPESLINEVTSSVWDEQKMCHVRRPTYWLTRFVKAIGTKP